MFSVLYLVSTICYVFAQSNTNIYGYDYGSDSNPNALNLVQNPNYQFLNDQLANEYARTYQQEVQQYDQSQGSGTNGFVTSSSSVPAVGYYTGPALSNQQQNSVNYQQIVQRNPQTTVGGSTNIYGYGYSSGSGSTNTNTGSGQYNNQQLYSPSSSSYSASTAQPYVYPFGQYAPSTATQSSFSSNNQNQNQVLRDSSSTGQTYTLFDQPQSAVTGYQSASDLKTTTLRDQALPATLNLRGAGPLPGPTISGSGTITSGNTNNNNQVFRDTSSTSYYYGGNTNANTNTNTNTNSRFFDVPGNQTVMYYPYRTASNFNIVPGTQTSSAGGNTVQYDQSTNTFSSQTNTGRWNGLNTQA